MPGSAESTYGRVTTSAKADYLYVMPNINDDRIRLANDRPLNEAGQYVLYWCQMYRRWDRNHAIDAAIAKAKELGKPLVVYEYV